MNWLQQKRRVDKLEGDALSAKLAQQEAVRHAHRQLEASLRKPGVWAWSFSLGMLWELSRGRLLSGAGSVKTHVSRLSKFALFTLRIIGSKM